MIIWQLFSKGVGRLGGRGWPRISAKAYTVRRSLLDTRLPDIALENTIGLVVLPRYARNSGNARAQRSTFGRPVRVSEQFVFIANTKRARVFFDFYVSRPFSARIFYYNKQYVRNAVPPPPATNYLARSFFFLPLLIFFVSKRDDNPRDPRVLHVTHTASP